MPFHFWARVKTMTRETKLGLVVSCSFLGLLGVVLGLKLTEPPEGDNDPQVAQASQGDGPAARPPARTDGPVPLKAGEEPVLVPVGGTGAPPLSIHGKENPPNDQLPPPKPPGAVMPKPGDDGLPELSVPGEGPAKPAPPPAGTTAAGGDARPAPWDRPVWLSPTAWAAPKPPAPGGPTGGEAGPPPLPPVGTAGVGGDARPAPWDRPVWLSPTAWAAPRPSAPGGEAVAADSPSPPPLPGGGSTPLPPPISVATPLPPLPSAPKDPAGGAAPLPPPVAEVEVKPVVPAGRTGTVGAAPDKPRVTNPTIDAGPIDEEGAEGTKGVGVGGPPPVGPKPSATGVDAPPAKGPEPIVVGGVPRASVPPLSVPPSPAPAPPRAAPPDVISYVEETYVANPGDSFESISKAKYGTDQYAHALWLFNRSHPLAGDDLLQDERLKPRQKVYIPPAEILESRYPGPAQGAAPAPRAGVAVGSESRRSDAPPAPRGYRVGAGGEKVYDIARNLLGDGNRWVEIAKLNPGWNPELPIPEGTTLAVPADARLPK